MYENFYNLKEKPFNMNPDSRFFFPSERHTEALSNLLYTVNERRGFAVITGEIGSGKTTVCRTLFNKLERGMIRSISTEPLKAVSSFVTTQLMLVSLPVPGRVRMEPVGNVCFASGAVHCDNGDIRLYYGAADTSICIATCALDQILEDGF